MTSKVAIVEFNENIAESFGQAVRLIGGIGDLNTAGRSLVVKVGVFNHKEEKHASVALVNSIINGFDRAPKIFIAESDNYKGTGSERLQIWKELFTERVVPFNLSDDPDTKSVKLAAQEINLSHILFKPNVLVSTHILRDYEKGSILKNLFGCVPTPKKAKYHKVLYELLADIFEALGGVDLAVLDGTYLWRAASKRQIRANALILGRDAVAVETVGAALAGLYPEKMPLIQEFVKRDLGEGDLKNIEIVGTSVEGLKEKIWRMRKEKV